MQIVIDIPEHAYEECKAVEFSEALEGVPFHVMKAIANGTPLPKGHGRLIDADKLKGCVLDEVTMPYVPIRRIGNAPTIIEADKAESEDNNVSV